VRYKNNFDPLVKQAVFTEKESLRFFKNKNLLKDCLEATAEKEPNLAKGTHRSEELTGSLSYLFKVKISYLLYFS
jgi:hypothetical protein